MGYTTLTSHSRVVALLVDGKPVSSAAPGQTVDLVMDSTPFYAESGGQVGDHGVLETAEGARIQVADVQKAGGGRLFVHRGQVEGSVPIAVDASVQSSVDAALRRRVRPLPCLLPHLPTVSHSPPRWPQARCNHTATHLLQSALKQVLGADVSQAGSLVDFERLRFDFNSPVAPTMGLTEARAVGAVAMFGEKYGDVVRVVDVPGVSMELCGGTHVANTAEIGAIKVSRRWLCPPPQLDSS